MPEDMRGVDVVDERLDTQSTEATEARDNQAPVSESRRSFIKGVIATGASVSAASYVLKNGTVVRAQAPGAVERLVTLSVNGLLRRVDVLPQETLATTLRYKLGLTGTKIGCDRSECGACTVLIDGTLHPVQQAVVDEQGFQCAFCMPGFVMNMVALVEENPNPTRKEAAHFLSGNLCRCADYNKILNVALRAAEYTRRG